MDGHHCYARKSATVEIRPLHSSRFSIADLTVVLIRWVLSDLRAYAE
jgi:hypothetical protein